MQASGAYWLQQALNCMQLVAFYLPLATAFALLQGMTRRIFLSFGDIGMYASFAAIYACFSAMLHGRSDVTAALYALAMAIASGAALGYGIARLVFGRRLLAHAQAYMIASIGLSIALQEIMRMQSSSRDVWVPPLFQGINVLARTEGAPVTLPFMTVASIAVAAAAMIVLALVLRLTGFGFRWRACAQSMHLARLCGIDTDRVLITTFAVAAGLASVSGWTSAIVYGGANFSTGLMMGFKAMFASVAGGFGTLRGAVAGAILLALIEVLWSAFFSTTYRDVAVFAIIVLILLLRPEGLLGTADWRESERP